jgi:predicted small secreted protein
MKILITAPSHDPKMNVSGVHIFMHPEAFKRNIENQMFFFRHLILLIFKF